MAVFFASLLLFAALCWQLAASDQGSWLHLLVATFVGIFLGDFISGIVHLFLDHLRNYKHPLFGKMAFEFQMHHIDPLRATKRGDLVDHLGMTGWLGMPVAVLSLALPMNSSSSAWWLGAVGAVTIVVGMFSQPIHLWVHAPESSPWIIRALQGIGLVISKEYHDVHHTAPFKDRFSIVTGWANWLIDLLRLERIFLRLIAKNSPVDIEAFMEEARSRGVIVTREQVKAISVK